jgi:hypothetical protein
LLSFGDDLDAEDAEHEQNDQEGNEEKFFNSKTEKNTGN